MVLQTPGKDPKITLPHTRPEGDFAKVRSKPVEHKNTQLI